MDIKSFTLEMKNNDGNYIPLYPISSKEQVMGWNIGELFGPYSITLKSIDWIERKQNILINGLTAQDYVNCVKKLSGSKDSMSKQEIEYSKISNVQSLNNQLVFSCDDLPTEDIELQIWWTR